MPLLVRNTEMVAILWTEFRPSLLIKLRVGPLRRKKVAGTSTNPGIEHSGGPGRHVIGKRDDQCREVGRARGRAADPAAVILRSVLSLIGGSTDIIGFLALNGLFTAYITGNIIVMVAYIAASDPTILSYTLSSYQRMFYNLAHKQHYMRSVGGCAIGSATERSRHWGDLAITIDNRLVRPLSNSSGRNTGSGTGDVCRCSAA